MSTSTSEQIPNQKAKSKTDISCEQHSKQANIRQAKLWKVAQQVKPTRFLKLQVYLISEIVDSLCLDGIKLGFTLSW